MRLVVAFVAAISAVILAIALSYRDAQRRDRG